MASIRIIGEKLHGNGMKGVYTAEEILKSGLLPKLLKLLPKLLKKIRPLPDETAGIQRTHFPAGKNIFRTRGTKLSLIISPVRRWPA